MTTTDRDVIQCPKCGAELSTKSPVREGACDYYWSCGSIFGPFVERQSEACRFRELTVERDRLAADLAVVTADNAVLLKAVKDTAFYTTDATVTYCRHCSVYRDGSGLREHEKRDHSSSCLMLQSHPGTTLIAKIEGLEDKIKTLDASTEPCVIDEARWLDERNAGGESIARMILEGASGDGMSDGPIPQALKLVEGLRRLADAKSIRIEKLERLAVVVKKRRDGSEEFQSLLLLADGADRRGRLNEYSDRRDAELDEMDDLLDELEPIPSPAVSVEAGEAKKAGANE